MGIEMKKVIGLFYAITALLLEPCQGTVKTVIHDIQGNKMVRSAIGVAVRRSYQDVKSVHSDVRPLQEQPEKGTALMDNLLNQYFHDESSRACTGYRNSFEVPGGLRGCIYSIDTDALGKKIFVVFPGTQTTIEWAKNFFGVVHFENNVQKSYHDDTEALCSQSGAYPFLDALYKHANAKNSGYRDLNSANTPENLGDYEYYFSGHSRGGGLALLAAKMFKEDQEVGLPRDHVKVVTFCSPKLTNAHVEQMQFVETLGFENMVHFVRTSDVAPHFPFRFVDNYGVRIPLVSTSFWNVKQAHRIPDEEEIEKSVNSFNLAQGIGWWDPLKTLFTLEPKALLWGIGGAYITLFLIKKLPPQLVIDLRNHIAYFIYQQLDKNNIPLDQDPY